MRTKKALAADIDATLTTRAITQTFEEIAAARMQTMRASVAQTRAFLEEVDQVFHEVKRAYVSWYALKKDTKAAKNLSEDSAIDKNGKICRVLISAGGGLYGDLPLRIVKKFVDEYRVAVASTTQPIDVVAIGSVGQYLLDAQNPKIPYSAFYLNDDKPSDDDINKIITFLVPYDTVTVTYGRFQSLLSLIPETTDITGGVSVANAVQVQAIPQYSASGLKKFVLTPGEKVLFEPSVATITRFFETEIIKALFRQKIFEMQLSRYASRMVAMDTATASANDRIKELAMEQRKLKRKVANQKLQQQFGGATIW